MKVLVGAFNQENAIVIVKTDFETDGALHRTRKKLSVVLILND